MSVRPFVDYYRRNGISPVDQDVRDIALHFERRESLYLALGITPRFVEGRTVVEFGPGSGHNALYTASLHPARYVLVDANPVGLSRAGDLLDRYGVHAGSYKLVESLIESYATDARFDFVFCEGTIPGQLDPSGFARTVGSFAAPGGIFVLTAQDAASCLAELLRRLVAAQIASRSLSVSEQLARLVPVFAPHTATLAGMSRPVEDWVLDNVIQPYIGNMFSIVQAIEALATDGFEIYGSAPSFYTRWLWYKRMTGRDRDPGTAASAGYLANVVNMMDYRLGGAAKHASVLGERILALAEEFYVALRDAENGASYAPAIDGVRAIAASVRTASPSTAESLDEALTLCAAASSGAPLPDTPSFRSFFGHGQQYLSFVKRMPISQK